MERLEAFRNFDHPNQIGPNQIGPGVWDIHSPRVPDAADMTALLNAAVRLIQAARLWVNPDCGMKTRGWPEVEQSLSNLVHAAHELRKTVRDPAMAMT